MNQTVTIKANPHPGQYMIHQSPARFKVLAAGRRWGKTRLGVNECLDVACQGGRAWWVSPTYKTGEVGWRPLRRMGSKIDAEIRRADRQVNLAGGGSVTVRSADNPDSLRGEGLDFVVLDECAFMQEDAWIEAIRPALSDRQGGAMFISTPKGRNWFWRLWMRGQGDYHDWQSWQLPTRDNPYIDEGEIEAARDSLPELIFEQEYLAIFLESEGTVFRNLAACMNAPADSTHKDHHRHKLICGVDWGKQEDFTAISIGCATCRVEVAIDRFKQIDYLFQQKRLKSLIDEWKFVTAVLPERNSIGDPIIEQLIKDKVRIVSGPDGKAGFMTTATSKPPLIENLALTFEREEWQFIADPIWTGEHEAYERKVSPVTGRSQYGAPLGMHDDTVIARALMVWAGRHSAAMPDQPESKSRWAGVKPEQDDNGSRWKRY